jgi:hypothetical protein
LEATTFYLQMVTKLEKTEWHKKISVKNSDFLANLHVYVKNPNIILPQI